MKTRKKCNKCKGVGHLLVINPQYNNTTTPFPEPDDFSIRVVCEVCNGSGEKIDTKIK